jgi:release factor glutamine methyltransferase
VTTSLALPLLRRLRHSVDLLIFNPPYVPTNTEEVDSAQCITDIAGSWAGGVNGMHVTDVFLPIVKVRIRFEGQSEDLDLWFRIFYLLQDVFILLL